MAKRLVDVRVAITIWDQDGKEFAVFADGELKGIAAGCLAEECAVPEGRPSLLEQLLEIVHDSFHHRYREYLHRVNREEHEAAQAQLAKQREAIKPEDEIVVPEHTYGADGKVVPL